MTTKELVEVLNALKNSADSEKKSADSANHSDNFFMTSPLFAKMIATLNVMEHDFGSDGKNSFGHLTVLRRSNLYTTKRSRSSIEPAAIVPT
mmetsp:Transcript_11589/g.26438  ORF Transcript_11589/g.26438 Transcript_11589/m.26438 type:complete len:92 (+) Transcript_11589:1101-1376(+)